MNDRRCEMLLINRDSDFIEVMARFFDQAGFTLHTASDMRGALSVLSSHTVEVIICDNALRDVTGREFLRFLKNDPLRESIPFIFLVPLDDQGHPRRAFELGAIDHIVYPLDMETLVERIRGILKPDYPPNGKVSECSLSREENNVAVAVQGDRRRDHRAHPGPRLNVEVSRDGRLWMPAQVKNFSRAGIAVETSLLGKPGVSLKIRVWLPQGYRSAEGRVVHIEFNDIEQPIGMGIQFEKNLEWKKITDYFFALIGSESNQDQPGVPAGFGADVRSTFILSEAEIAGLSRVSELPQRNEPEEKAYDARFYHSLIGKQIDNYRVIAFLGSGTMGGVFKALDSVLERTAALKVISYELSEEEAFREMFIKEARLVSKLNHPNIAHIYSIGNTNGILYFTMEFVEGTTMADLIANRGNLNTLSGLEYFITVCQTLNFVWEKNIIHRDIKPQNILVNSKGILKVVDFSVAKHLDKGTDAAREEVVVGSPLYICPDAILGKPLDHRSDIYSLGATFYHAFTGFPPFEGESAKAILIKHINDEPPSPKKRNPKVSETLCRVIEKMLAKNPENRYQSYQEVIHDLQSFRSRYLAFKRQEPAASSAPEGKP